MSSSSSYLCESIREYNQEPEYSFEGTCGSSFLISSKRTDNTYSSLYSNVSGPGRKAKKRRKKRTKKVFEVFPELNETADETTPVLPERNYKYDDDDESEGYVMIGDFSSHCRQRANLHIDDTEEKTIEESMIKQQSGESDGNLENDHLLHDNATLIEEHIYGTQISGDSEPETISYNYDNTYSESWHKENIYSEEDEIYGSVYRTSVYMYDHHVKRIPEWRKNATIPVEAFPLPTIEEIEDDYDLYAPYSFV